MGARNSYPLVLDGNEQFQLTVSPHEHFRLTLMGPERMGALEVDGLQQRCALITTPCALMLLPGIPNGEEYMVDIPNGALMILSAGKMHGAANMMAASSTSIVLSPVNAQAYLDVPGVPQSASLLIDSGALETLIIVGTSDGVALTLSSKSAFASGDAFAVGISELHIRPGNPSAFMTAPGAGSAYMMLGSSGRAAQTVPGDGGQVVMHLTSVHAAATMISPTYVGTDIDAPMSRFMDDTMADFMFTEVV